MLYKTRKSGILLLNFTLNPLRLTTRKRETRVTLKEKTGGLPVNEIDDFLCVYCEIVCLLIC